MAYIETEHLYKSYGNKTVLENIELSIEKGDRFGLIGPNGAGKTTLIDLLTGLRRPDSGKIRIAGFEMPQDKIEIRRRIGLVPQELALIDTLNARDNLMYFGSLYDLDGKTLKSRVDEALEVAGLADAGKKKVKKFSGGMKRRLNIACAIMHRPELLILDEPTVGVDPQSRNYIFDYLKGMNKGGTTIFYTSHYMEEVESLCNRVLLLDEGKTIASGTPKSVADLVADSERYLLEIEAKPGAGEILRSSVVGIREVTEEKKDGELVLTIKAAPGTMRMMDVIGCVEKNGWVLRSIDRKEYTLEEAFLRLTGKSLRD